MIVAACFAVGVAVGAAGAAVAVAFSAYEQLRPSRRGKGYRR
jgi:hypothetical protein